MELTRDSLLSKTYRWFYNTHTMPNNLCEYFWRLVIMVLLIIPSAILSSPINFLGLLSKDSNYSHSNLPGPGFVAWVALFLIQSIIVFIVIVLFLSFPEDGYLYHVGGIGLVMFFSVVIGLIFYAFSKITPRKVNLKQNIAVEYLKAKKNKYCPKIDWK